MISKSKMWSRPSNQSLCLNLESDELHLQNMDDLFEISPLRVPSPRGPCLDGSPGSQPMIPRALGQFPGYRSKSMFTRSSSSSTMTHGWGKFMLRKKGNSEAGAVIGKYKRSIKESVEDLKKYGGEEDEDGLGLPRGGYLAKVDEEEEEEELELELEQEQEELEREEEMYFEQKDDQDEEQDKMNEAQEQDIESLKSDVSSSLDGTDPTTNLTANMSGHDATRENYYHYYDKDLDQNHVWESQLVRLTQLVDQQGISECLESVTMTRVSSAVTDCGTEKSCEEKSDEKRSWESQLARLTQMVDQEAICECLE